MERMDTSSAISRRRMMQAAAAVAAAGTMPAVPGLAQQGPGPAGRKRALRIAHLTDIHVQPERKGDGGMAACLRHVQAQKDKPELILTGGDLIMDSGGADEARTRLQWDVFKRVLRDECGLPIEHCIGNHDVWGIHKKDSKTTGSEPLHGKKWVMEELELPQRYRSFDRAGWHFIVLDSTFVLEDSYTAKLDEEQFEWLQDDLKKADAGKPVLVLSHIPILSATCYFDGQNEKSGDWVVPGSWMHIDARRIKDLFIKHPNVKLCLSGHIHLADRVDYLGVSYLCNGAVCGAWWKGINQECDAGYGLIDLYADGSFESQYVNYGWKAVEA